MFIPSALSLAPILIAILVIALTLIVYNRSPSAHPSSVTSAGNIRKMLPNNLSTWRVPGRHHEDEVKVWSPLVDIFHQGGLDLWPIHIPSLLKCPNYSDNPFPLPSGYAYASSHRGLGQGPGCAGRLASFMYTNNSTRIARTRDGYDVAVRVIVIKNEGHDHLKILRKIAAGPLSLLSDNHALPLLSEFLFEDIIFGLFPRVGACMEEAFSYWAQNSVGDVMDMFMQALEALAFIHASNIAHRDAFSDNFLVQWHPESMRTMSISVSRPRVYLIDFEVAVEFPVDCPQAERVCSGYPQGGSLTNVEEYCRPLAPEITAAKPYCPFKLDMWQFGSCFASFKTKTEEIDGLISDLTCPDPACRMDAVTALKNLQNVIFSMPPRVLLITPHVLDSQN